MKTPRDPSRPIEHPDGSEEAVTRSVVLDVEPEQAWRMIGTEEGLAQWLGAEVTAAPEAGGALRLVDDDGVERRGRILDVEHGRRLRFTWSPADGDDDLGEASTVTLSLDRTPAGATRVTVVEARSGGRVAACLDAGAAWDQRLVGLELGALVGRSALVGAAWL